MFLAPADRFNAKTLAKLAAPFLDKAAELAATFATNADNEPSFAALREVGGVAVTPRPLLLETADGGLMEVEVKK